jgi:hypothetical protein
MKIDGKNRWLFKLDHNTFYNQDVIIGVSFENERLKISSDGEIMIKASRTQPFTWDGNTPKWNILDIVVGTPDGVVHTLSGLRKTQRASLLHDALYQFAPRDFVTRSQADKLSLLEMKKTKFKLARLYWVFVRLFGWFWWNKNSRS